MDSVVVGKFTLVTAITTQQSGVSMNEGLATRD